MVKQRFDKGAGWRRGSRPLADELQLQRSAKAIRRVEFQRRRPGLSRHVEPLGRLLHLAKTEPARRPLRRQFQRAEQQLRRCRVLARAEKHLGIVGATVGSQVAGRDFQRLHGDGPTG
ncbi:hypothetical protein X727_10515 [Mesorhizobium sp. L103C119B0]|nr:hypothetical protein X727_10515 [Mesorhizobium sp. L103C119B0]